MKKYENLHRIALFGDTVVVCFAYMFFPSVSPWLLSILLLPFTAIGIWGAVDYKKSGEKVPVQWGRTLSGAHPYLATAVIIFANVFLVLLAILGG